MKHLERLKATTAATNPGQDLQPEQLMPALSQGLHAVMGRMKLLSTTSGKFHTKVFSCSPGKGRDFYKLLSVLDFSALRTESTQTYSGTRLEINGKRTYVTYSAVGGVVVISSNASDIDI